ncbi:hypothetical protein H7X46_17665 [Pseudonocardia sp. C8]|uniref:hypothetical protein n=1 Tax=Pseudonocardia sp. C8 TaxID=2762759 RepID=UPI0016429E20|nr:hypothetical protein [Pseudonocardia sp. C8]MBC3192888.1 hypothetical protein [Pseudonocardia sp. C8]
MPRSLARAPMLAEIFPEGVASRAQLLALGISKNTIDARCRPGGPWKKLVMGIVQLDGRRTTPHQYCRAALLHAGPGAMLTGVAGAGLHGVVRTPDERRIAVLIPAGRRVASRDFVLVMRTDRPPDPESRRGLPVAPLARCLVDAAARCADRDAVRALFADAVQRGLCRVADLTAELDEPRRPYTARARAALIEIDGGARSAAEAWAREVIRGSSLPSPQWNVALHAPDGRMLGVVDAYWDDVGLAWEIQSNAYHLAPEAFERDVEKQVDLPRAGVVLVPTLAKRLRSEPRMVVAELTDAYARAAAMPPPAVTASLWRP